MYGPPGVSYVYFTYGNHFMTNLVCGPEGVAGGVLLRALEPLEGIATMSRRRGGRLGTELCNGPGKLSQALGIDLSDNGKLLGQGRLQVCEGMSHSPQEVVTTGRIGLTSGHELPYRFFLASDAHVSRARTGPKR
jgi:DNA-3-methyladenine glycosylase